MSLNAKDQVRIRRKIEKARIQYFTQQQNGKLIPVPSNLEEQLQEIFSNQQQEDQNTEFHDNDLNQTFNSNNDLDYDL